LHPADGTWRLVHGGVPPEGQQAGVEERVDHRNPPTAILRDPSLFGSSHFFGHPAAGMFLLAFCASLLALVAFARATVCVE